MTVSKYISPEYIFRGAALLLALWLSLWQLVPAVSAADTADAADVEQLPQDAELESLLAQFREDWGLDEDDFAMAYVNLDTGETVTFQYDQWMVAGSTYKVPLAMLYYDRINVGELTLSSTVGGLRLDSALEKMIVNSDNDVAKTLMYAIGNNVWSSYRELLTGYSEQEYPSRFYNENVLNCRYMVDCLTVLYENAEDYETLLDHMAEAMPGQYFQKYVTDYTVCHKYGLYNGAVNDVAIVYGPQTYILVAFSQGVSGAETMLGELNALVCDYLEARVQAEDEATEAEAEAEAEEDAAAEAEIEDTSEETEEPETTQSAGIQVESLDGSGTGDTVASEETVGAETETEPGTEATGFSPMAVLLPMAAACAAALLVALCWLIWRQVRERR